MAEEKKNLFSRIFGKKDDEDEKKDEVLSGAGSVSGINKIPEVNLDFKKNGLEKYEDGLDKTDFISMDEREKQGMPEGYDSYKDVYKDIQNMKLKAAKTRLSRSVQDIAPVPLKVNEDGKTEISTSVSDWKRWFGGKISFALSSLILGANFLEKGYNKVQEVFYDDEELYKKKLYKKSKNMSESESKNIEKSLEDAESLFVIQDMGYKDPSEIEKISELYYEKINTFNGFSEPIKELGSKIEQLEKENSLLAQMGVTESSDGKTIEDRKKEIKQLELEQFKKYVEFTLGAKIKDTTEEAIIGSIKQTLGVSEIPKNIDSILSKKEREKVLELQNLAKELDNFNIEYQTRVDTNVTELTKNSITKVLEDNGILLSDFGEQAMFDGVFGDYNDILNVARLDPVMEKNTKIKLSLLNEFVKMAFTNTFISGGDAKIGAQNFEKIMNSNEMQKLKEYMVLGENVNNFFDENGNFDYAGFREELQGTTVFMEFAGLLNDLNIESKVARKREQQEDSSGVFQKLWKGGAALGYETIFAPGGKGYDSYLKEKEKIEKNGHLGNRGAAENITLDYKLQRLYEKAGGEVDKTLIEIARKDQEYASNTWARIGDTITTWGNVLQDNPAQTVGVLASFMVPLLGTASKVSNLTNTILKVDKIASPFWKTSMKIGSTIGSELAEGVVVGGILDSFGGAEADARWLFVDGAIGGIKSVSLLKDAISGKNLKSTINGIENILSKNGIEKGSQQYIDGIKDGLYLDGKYIFVKYDGKTLDDFIDKSGKIDYIELHRSMERGKLKLATDTQGNGRKALEMIYSANLKEGVESGKINGAQLDSLFQKAKVFYGDDFGIINKGGKLSKLEVVSRFLADTINTAEKAESVRALRGLSDLAKTQGLTSKIDQDYDTLTKTIQSAMKSASPEEKVVLEKAQTMLDERRSEAGILPFYLATDQKNITWGKFSEKTRELNRALKELNFKGVKTDIGDLYDLPDEIIKNIDNPAKIAELIQKNSKEYEKFGIKTYNLGEFLADNEKKLVESIGEDGFNNLKQIVDTVEGVSDGKVLIYELPNSIRKMVADVSGFTTFVKDGPATKVVIGTVGGLTKMVSGGKGLTNEGNIKYIKELCYNLGHTVMFSLKPKIQAQLTKFVSSLLGESRTKETISNLLPNVSKDRIEVLSKIKDPTELVQEISADYMSDAIQNTIFGKQGGLKSFGDAVTKKVGKGDSQSLFADEGNLYNKLAMRFATMFEALYNGTVKSPNMEDLKGTMHYMAAQMIEGNKKWTNKWFDIVADTYTPLHQEARKYKSAEEFINSKERVYHGTNAEFDKFDISKIGSQTDDGIRGRGIYFSPNKEMARMAPKGNGTKYVKEVFIDKNKLFDIAKYKNIQKLADDLDMWEGNFRMGSDGIIRPNQTQINQLTTHIEDLGYEGVYVNRGGKGDELVIFNPKNIRTESQLKQIREEANKVIKPDIKFDTPLHQEARKYKSAEEFIDSLPIGGKEGRAIGRGEGYVLAERGKNLYDFDTDKIKYYFKDGKIPEEITLYRASKSKDLVPGDYLSRNRNVANAFGQDVYTYKISSKDLTYGKGKDDFVFIGDLKKTESQLKQIREEANLEKMPIDTFSEQKKFFWYKARGDKYSILKQGINGFDSAELYSVGVISDRLKDTAVTAEGLGEIIPLQYRNTEMQGLIIEEFGEGSKEVKKFFEALQFAEDRHIKSINGLIDSYKDGVLDFGSEDLNRYLLNISPRLTNQSVIETAVQDLQKYINIASKDQYNQIVTMTVNKLSKQYGEGTINTVSGFLRELGFNGDTLGEQYLKFMNAVEDSITSMAKKTIDPASKLDPEDLSKDVVSRLFIGAQGYINTLENAAKATANTTTLVDEMAMGLLRKNKFRGEGAYSDMYSKILAGFEDMKLDKEFADTMSQVVMTRSKAVEKGFERASYELKYFNYLSANMSETLAATMSELKLKINIPQNIFSQFVDKISLGRSRYDVAIEGFLGKKGILDSLDFGGITLGKNKEDIISSYVKSLEENRVKIIADKGEDVYTEAIQYLEKMMKDGLSSDDVDYFLTQSKKAQNSFGANLNIDAHLRDVSNSDDILYNFKSKTEKSFAGLYGGATPEKTIKRIENLKSPKTEQAVSAVTEYIDSYTKMIDDVKAFGFEEVSAKVIDNDLFSSFFDISSANAKVKITEIDRGNRKTPIKKLAFFNDSYSSKNYFLTKTLKNIVGAFTNISTVADSDKMVADAVISALGKMDKHVFVFDGAMKKVLAKAGMEGKFVGKKTYLGAFQGVAEEHIRKGGLTYEKLVNDISATYNARYHKVGNAKYVGSSFDSVGYKDLVDSYVELLAKNHEDFGRYKLVLDGKTIIKDELSDLLASVGSASDGKIVISGKRKEANKVLGLGGYRLGLSPDQISVLKEKAAVFHPKMFNNFLYKAMASTDTSFNWVDDMVKLGRNAEKMAANAQYAMFYSVFFAGFPAASQQAASNMVHLLSKKVSELGSENIDFADDIMKFVDGLMPTDLLKTNLLADRPELYNATMKKQRRVSKLFDRFLQNQSALARTDKASESAVKKYSLTSSLLEKGYSPESAKEFLGKISSAIDDFDTKGLSEYIEIERYIRFGKDDAIKKASYKIDEAVNAGKITAEEGGKILEEIKKYGPDFTELKNITDNARIKTTTFYQMSSTPELVQNYIGGVVGTANMRFLNRASRKAGDYGFKIAYGFVNGDIGAIEKIIKQVSLEALYVGKMKMLVDNQSEGGVDFGAFYNSLFLPMVLLNMTMLNVPEKIGRLMGGGYNYGEEGNGWETVSKFVIDLFTDSSSRISDRLFTAPKYWLTQYLRITNGLKDLGDGYDNSQAYSGWMANVPILNKIVEVFGNSLQSRVGRFSTDSTSGIYRNYLNNSQTNNFLNAMFNAKMTNDVVTQDRMKQGFHNAIMKTDGRATFGRTIIGAQADRKFAKRAFEQFYKEYGLEQFNGGPNVGKLLEELNTNTSKEDIRKSMREEGAMYSEIEKMLDEQLKESRKEEGITDDELKNLGELSNKGFEIMTSSAIMNGTQTDKDLLNLGIGVTPEERAKYVEDVKALYDEIYEEILEKDILGLAKAGAFDKPKIIKTIESGKNKFGEQVRIGVIMRAMSNANKAMIKSIDKRLEGDNYKYINKTPEYKESVERRNADFQKTLASELYNTVLMGNRTMATRMQTIYTNTHPNNPLSSELNDYSSLGTNLSLSLLEKSITSQGLAAIGTTSAYSEMTKRFRTSYENLDDKDREKALPGVLRFLSDSVDAVNQYTDPLLGRQMLAGIAYSNIDHLLEISKDGELMEKMSGPFKDILDQLTVSEPLSDDVILENIRDGIFKEPGSGKKKRGSIGFNKLVDNLNKFSGFKGAFYENVLKQKPLEHIQYRAKGNRIIPIKLPEAEAKKIIAKYDFIKPKAPVSEKTPDIVVQTIKTTKASGRYSGKNIKGQNVYTVKKTKRGR